MQNIKIFVPSLKGDPLVLWYHFINIYLLYLLKTNRYLIMVSIGFTKCYSEFLTEVNSNKKTKFKEGMFESTQQVIRSRQSQMDRQRSKEKKTKRTKNDLQNTTQIAKIN